MRKYHKDPQYRALSEAAALAVERKYMSGKLIFLKFGLALHELPALERCASVAVLCGAQQTNMSKTSAYVHMTYEVWGQVAAMLDAWLTEYERNAP